MKAARKSSSTRRAAALTFLSGLSLDGKPECAYATTPSPTSSARLGFERTDKKHPAWTSSDTAEKLSKKPTRERVLSPTTAEDHVIQQMSKTKDDTITKKRLATGMRSMSGESLISSVNLTGLTFSNRLRKAERRGGNVDGTLVITGRAGFPIAVFSTLGYRKGDRKESGVDKHRPKLLDSENKASLIEGVQVGKAKNAVSYCKMLRSTYASQSHELAVERQEILTLPLSPSTDCSLATVTGTVRHRHSVYNPNLFDDPDLQSGKFRKVMTMQSYRLSVVEYARPSHIKRDLNDQFRERYPHIQLTLSKLRSIKKSLLKVALKSSLDLVVVAVAYVYFEKFVWKRKVNKVNRKITAGCCLLLAAKMSDVKRVDIRPLMDNITDGLHIPHRELLQYEFPVLVALEFSLHVPYLEVQPHLDRLESSV
jgi:hypothetical protein